MATPRLHDICIVPTGAIRADYDPASPAPEDWVYQRRARGKGNIHREHGPELQLRRKGIRHDRTTSKNAPHRARFTAANAAWQALTESEKDAYRERAASLPLTGYNLWMREYSTTPTPERLELRSVYNIIGLRLLEIL